MTDLRTVSVTNTLSWVNLIHESPYTSWNSLYIINDGPSGIEVGVNYPDNRYMVSVGEEKLFLGVVRIIYLKCFPGLNASVRIGEGSLVTV